MRSLIRFAVLNPVAANLVFLAILVVGGMTVGTLPREVFPDFSRQGVEVQVAFPNASPEEVERLCTIPIEEAADSVEGTYEILSYSQQDWARVLVELRDGTDLQQYLDELRMEIDAIEDWPEDAEEVRVFEQRVEFPVITVNLFGNLGELATRDVAEDLRDQLKRIPHVAAVQVFGVREPELWVEVEPEQLERYGLTLAEISGALGLQLRDLPGGTLQTEAGEVRLRVLGEETDPEALGRRPVRALPDGTLLRLADVARVSQDFERARTHSRYNGFESVSLNVTKDDRGDIIDMVDAVEALIEAERPGLPAGLSVGVSSDFSIYVKNRLNTLLQSGLFGLALVLIILWLFLDARAALMTALGIPAAVTGGIIMMGVIGITMNMLSMFSFILVLGMIVDDAIVVVENCFRYLERGLSPRDAALRGAAEVAWPVLTTITTTVTAFSAMLMIEGELGQWMEPVPWVASLTLAASLIEALAVLPAHFAEWMKPMRELEGAEAAAAAPVDDRLARDQAAGGRWYAGLLRVYNRLLAICARHRYSVILASFGGLLCAGAVFHSGHLKFVLLPRFEAKLFMVNLETPTSYSLEQTREVVAQLDQAVGELPDYELESYVALSGATYADQTNYRSGLHLGQVFVELSEGGDRTRSTSAIQEDLRQRIGRPPGLVSLDFSEPNAGPAGSPIELRLSAREAAVREAATAAVMDFLASFPGVIDLKNDLLPGPREVRLRLTDEGRMLGFSEAELARQVLGSFYGDRATILRLDRDPADLLVRHPEEARLDFRQLNEMRVRAPSGASLPLARVAALEEDRGLAEVVRRDRRRSVTITADVRADANAREILRALDEEFADFEQRFLGAQMSAGGDQAKTVESIQSLVRALGIAFVIIYFLLAFLFGSYLQPAVVLLAVPFAALGVVFGFWGIGEPLSFMTMLGLLALSGVAVNDALVLVDFVNQQRAAGKDALTAVLNAGAVRMRPVLITSLTTIGGLTPLAFFASGQARFLSPMAQALIFGMVTATLMTLLLVPAGYLVLEDLLSLFRRLFRRLTPLTAPRTPS